MHYRQTIITIIVLLRCSKHY